MWILFVDCFIFFRELEIRLFVESKDGEGGVGSLKELSRRIREFMGIEENKGVYGGGGGFFFGGCVFFGFLLTDLGFVEV